ncbi:DNA-binding protein [Candidatus Acetothermia bacterium]|nr:MAG: DNA-binding protein [Candidatus Acetothermia bacterium]
MNKGEFIDRLADSTNLTKKEARRLLDSVLGLIQDTLLQGEEVKLVGFGKFGVRARKASSRINPQTKEQIHVDAKVVPLFKPGKELRRQIEKGLKVTPNGRVAKK